MSSSALAVPGSSCEMTHEERVRAFKSDPQLMEAATKFVNEVLERAKEEAMKRVQQEKARGASSAGPGTRGRAVSWHESSPRCVSAIPPM